MPEFIVAPPNFDPQEHVANASREIKNYTAIFILKDKRVGSGVFVNTCGVNGILTANHVAEPLLGSPMFALCVAEHPHSLWLRSEHFEHVPIGRLSQNPEPKNGPDLSFIIIRDAKLLEILRSLKSFCFLESQKVSYFNSPLHRMLWAIAGSPNECCKVIKENCEDGGPLTKLTNFVGDGLFQSRTVRGDFDYIEIKVPCDGSPYPYNYQGMSGGGLWVIPLEIDPDEDMQTVTHGAPLLAGVSYYQSEPQNGERVITGHGFDSIYARLVQTLKKKVWTQ